jgi:hypothetical protein
MIQSLKPPTSVAESNFDAPTPTPHPHPHPHPTPPHPDRRCLPAEVRVFSRRRLLTLDLSANPLGECPPPQLSSLARECFSAVPSLRELAARAVMRNGGPSRGGTVVVARLPAVVERYLEAGGRCSCCGGAFYQQHATFLTSYVTHPCACA